MKDNILNYLKKNKAIAIMLFLIVIAAFIPLSAFWVETLIMLNVFLAFGFTVVIFCTKKNIPFYPTFVLLSTIFSLTSNVSITRLILLKGASFDGELTNLLSSYIFSSEREKLIKGIIIILLIIITVILIIIISCNRISEVVKRINDDSLSIKLNAINFEYNKGSINEEEAQAKKKEVHKKTGFFGAMDSVSKFVLVNEKIRIIIFEISFLGAIIIGTSFNGKTINYTINSYFPLIISSGILCILPACWVSLGIWIIVTRNGGEIRLDDGEED